MDSSCWRNYGQDTRLLRVCCGGSVSTFSRSGQAIHPPSQFISVSNMKLLLTLHWILASFTHSFCPIATTITTTRIDLEYPPTQISSLTHGIHCCIIRAMDTVAATQQLNSPPTKCLPSKNTIVHQATVLAHGTKESPLLLSITFSFFSPDRSQQF